MRNGVRLTLIILSIILIIDECVYGIPFLGGLIIVHGGWSPIFFNAFLYAVVLIILLADRQNSIKPMAIIPLIGLIGSIIAIIPFVGLITHWILFFLMIFFLFIVFSAPVYIPNRHAKTIYNDEKRH
ncbi:hypothetical protein [Staphylococcus argensis]|uniref:Uncharacterized protein n=1 Tax=Staphylococcus argensis TaxID=1607738 RepID=A0A2K4FBY0_9STAP|nr:hypothetical protein [Staphylococcus argensis]MCY6991924.1 hypothetical protein [Staphylococcus argensis]POA08773.1 hypothetical protein CD039_07220 [Staphylococcus argensis]